MAGKDAPFVHARLDQIDPVADNPFVEGEWRPVRAHFGIEAFGTNAYTAREAGEIVIEDHTEEKHEELYFVARGHARFTLAEDETVEAPAGTFVFVRPPTRRVAVAEEPGTTVLAFGGEPGKAFRISAWERKYTRERERR